MPQLLCRVSSDSLRGESCLTSLQSEIAQSRVLIRTPAERPMIFSLRFFDWKIVNAGVPAQHQSVLIKFPVLVAVRAEPMSGIIVPFTGETHRDAIAVVGPQFFD